MLYHFSNKIHLKVVLEVGSPVKVTTFQYNERLQTENCNEQNSNDDSLE